MGSGNLIAALSIWALCVGLAIYLYFQPKPDAKAGQIVDPNTWALFLVLGLIICSGIVAMRYGLKFYRSHRAPGEAIQTNGPHRATMFWFLLLTLGYILSLKFIGYIFGTILFLTITYRFLGVRERKKLFLLPCVLVLIFVIVFGRILYIPLPRGSGIFYEITSLFVG